MANQTETLPETETNPALGVVYICLAITIMVTNGIIILVNIKSRHLQIPALHILTGIAVLAFVTGLNLLMYHVPLLFSAQITCNSTFTIAGSIMSAGQQALNIFHATLAVLDRYVAVCHPLRYMSVVNRRNLLLGMFANTGLCFVVLFIGLAVSLEQSSRQGFDCVITFTNMYLKVLFTSLLLIVPTCVITVSYIQICREYKARCTQSTMAYGGAPFRFPWLITCYLSWGAISVLPSFVLENFPFVPANFYVSYGFRMLRRSNYIMNIFIFTGTSTPFREQALILFHPSYYLRQRRNAAMRAAEEDNKLVTSPQYTYDMSTAHISSFHPCELMLENILS